jgi:hypothetical protein
VIEPDPPGGHRFVLGLGLLDRVEPGDGLGDQPLDLHHPAGVRDRGEFRVDPRGGLPRQAWVAAAIRRACHGATLSACIRGPIFGSR